MGGSHLLTGVVVCSLPDLLSTPNYSVSSRIIVVGVITVSHLLYTWPISQHSTCIYSLNHHNHSTRWSAGTMTTITVQVMELRPRQQMELAKDHRAKRQSQDLIPGIR